MKKILLGSIISSVLYPITLQANQYTIIIAERNYEIFNSTPSESAISIKPTTITEQDENFEFLLPLSEGSDINKNATVEYLIEHIDTTDGDVQTASGVFKFKNGKELPIQIKSNLLYENSERFRVTLSNPYLIDIDNGVAILTIQDDDGMPNITIDDASVVEGGNVLVKISLDKVSSLPVTVDYFTENGDATSPDYQSKTGSATIPAGQLETTIEISTLEDTTDENTEDFYVRLNNERNGFLLVDDAAISITDNDSAPTVSISNATILENDETNSILEFDITLSQASGKTVSVDFSTSDLTAVAGDDYELTNETITFLPYETVKKASVSINGDYVFEDHETLSGNISNPINTTITQSSAIGTISNNDVIYKFNVLPLYGIVEYNDGDGWKQVVANTEYSRIFDFRYNPTEADVLAVSRDINVGSFDTNPSTPYHVDGSHSLSEWGTGSGGQRTFKENGVTIKTSLKHGNFVFRTDPGTHLGVGLGSSHTSGHLMNGEVVRIDLSGDFLNDVRIAADGLGSCYDYANACETKVEIKAYDFDNKLIDTQGGYRQATSGVHGEAFVDNYYFTGETAIKYFEVRTVPTNAGGNNTNLSSGSNTLLNMTVSRSAFEVMDYKMIDVDGNEVTETLKLNINEGNANTNVDLNDILAK